MKFQIKSSIQWGISCLPMATRINRLLQMHATKSLPISDSELQARKEIAERHIKSYFIKRATLPTSVLDIGSGSDLSLPLIMKLSIQEVVATDINRLASDYLINNITDRIGSPPLRESGLKYIVYNPPKLPFDNESFDLITSTSVLEHVPRGQIIVLAKEIHRLLKSNGISTHHIAHKDHWSDSDPTIHPLNYLKYSEREWRIFNPPLLHQNRLLSSDYCRIFSDNGFEVERDLTKTPPPDFRISESFSQNPEEDFAITHTWLTLKKIPHNG